MSMSMKRSGGDGFLSALAAKAAATITDRIRQDESGSRGDFFRGFGSGRFNAFYFVDTYWDYFYVLT